MTWSTIQHLVLCMSFVVTAVCFAGGSGDIKTKQAKLEKLRGEIQKFEEKIKQSEKKETATLELLDTYDRQIILVRKLIENLRVQEDTLQQNITETRRAIRELGGQLSFVKKNYAGYVSSLYKYGRMYDLELLLSSKSVNQVFIRSEYLKRFSDQRKRDVTKITVQKDALEEENLKLQQQLVEQQNLISVKAREDQALLEKQKKRKSMLASIRKDKKNMRREIQRATVAARDLEELITKLIEQDRVRKALEAQKEKETKSQSPITPHPSSLGKNFSDKRGRMSWPVNRGKITGRFGNQQHPLLHTVTQNTGVDITVPLGSDVVSISDGEVSAISWLPSFGNLVIVDHSGGYRTVYAHLSEVLVTEGQRLPEGSVIGKSGESLSGPLLHFEVWKDREKQDPELWLAPHGLTKR